MNHLPEGLRNLPHDAKAEAAILLRHAVTDAAEHGAPEDTIREAIEMVRDDFRCDVELYDGEPEGHVVATYSMDEIGGRFHIPDESDPVLNRIYENSHT
jgi:hypothetical protein